MKKLLTLLFAALVTVSLVSPAFGGDETKTHKTKATHTKATKTKKTKESKSS